MVDTEYEIENDLSCFYVMDENMYMHMRWLICIEVSLMDRLHRSYISCPAYISWVLENGISIGEYKQFLNN